MDRSKNGPMVEWIPKTKIKKTILLQELLQDGRCHFFPILIIIIGIFKSTTQILVERHVFQKNMALEFKKPHISPRIWMQNISSDLKYIKKPFIPNTNAQAEPGSGSVREGKIGPLKKRVVNYSAQSTCRSCNICTMVDMEEWHFFINIIFFLEAAKGLRQSLKERDESCIYVIWF